MCVCFCVCVFGVCVFIMCGQYKYIMYVCVYLLRTSDAFAVSVELVPDESVRFALDRTNCPALVCMLCTLLGCPTALFFFK